MVDPHRAFAGAGPHRTRARRCRQTAFAAALALLGCGVAATIVLSPRPLLVWNASASAPIGLYRVGRVDGVGKGDMVIARLAEPYRSLAAKRHYLPANVPLVKRVAAVPGDRVCARGKLVFVNDRLAVARLEADARGRAMPWWRGCVRLGPTQLLLLMTSNPASFDGRYFGISERRDVIGRAKPLWTW